MKNAFNPKRRTILLQGAGLAVLAAGAMRAAHAAPQPASDTAQRVVVIGGALAEIVYALGKEAALVGSDTTCTYPEAAGKLPKIGYQRALSAEGLLSLRPDLIIASAEAGPDSVLQRVADSGVKMLRFTEHHDVGSVREKIGGVAAALRAPAAGETLLARFNAEWQHVQGETTHAPWPQLRVLFLLNPPGTQAMVAGQQTAADAMLRYAGVSNAMQGFNGYRALTPEALATARPDVVLTTSDALQLAGSKAKLLGTPGFALTPAGRNNRVVALDTLFLLGFGPRLPAAVASLRKGLTDAMAMAG